MTTEPSTKTLLKSNTLQNTSTIPSVSQNLGNFYNYDTVCLEEILWTFIKAWDVTMCRPVNRDLPPKKEAPAS